MFGSKRQIQSEISRGFFFDLKHSLSHRDTFWSDKHAPTLIISCLDAINTEMMKISGFEYSRNCCHEVDWLEEDVYVMRDHVSFRGMFRGWIPSKEMKC